MRWRSFLELAVASGWICACEPAAGRVPGGTEGVAPVVVAPPEAPIVAAPPSTVPRKEPFAIEEITMPDDLPIYVVRGAEGAGAIHTVFLTGSCTHPTSYLAAFRRAAARNGGLVALQGDRPCGDPKAGLRRYSSDSATTSRRIDAALARARGDLADASDVTLVGYSQGAERAEWLANRFPAKYTYFVLIASPIVPSAQRLAGARAVVTLAGRGDVRENMATGARALRRARIPAVYMELASRRHGDLDPSADAVLDLAFDWLGSNERPAGGRAKKG